MLRTPHPPTSLWPHTETYLASRFLFLIFFFSGLDFFLSVVDCWVVDSFPAFGLVASSRYACAKQLLFRGANGRGSVSLIRDISASYLIMDF